jgi:3-methyladenine DNA glycosylase AlkD
MQDKLTREALVHKLKAAGTAERAAGAARYFKTGAGEYGEGDVFLGVTTSALRKLARQYATLSLDDLQELLQAKEHECRALALTILVAQHKAADAALQRKVLKLYLRNTQYINNWDLVDLSCGSIVGCHLRTDAGMLLTKLARSKSLWERRIAMISTRALIREGDFYDALRVAELLLDDQHDLIHKAIGWVLREVGDKNRATLLKFLKTHYQRVPRTTLRYAIEHFSPELRKQMLVGNFEV